MPAVIEIISVLEKTSITKELLETTRLGKYINELRRKTTNDALAKRAKELLKRWRDQVLPTNTPPTAAANGKTITINDRASPDMSRIRKRPIVSPAFDETIKKRVKLNGNHSSDPFYISDNSNSSLKEIVRKNKSTMDDVVIIVNSDSNSSVSGIIDRIPNSIDSNLSFAGRNLVSKLSEIEVTRVPTPPTVVPEPVLEPKKRGRKKGSRNHKTLVVAAEESFTNKMAVSLNSKVKTTQELVASLQNKNLKSVPLKTDSLSSPKLAVSSPKLSASSPKLPISNFTANALKNLKNEVTVTQIGVYDNTLNDSLKNERSSMKKEVISRASSVASMRIEPEDENSRSSVGCASVISIGSTTKLKQESDDIEIIEIKEDESKPSTPADSKPETPDKPVVEESVEEILAKLPPIDYSVLEKEDDEPRCTCVRPEDSKNITIDFRDPTVSIFDVPDNKVVQSDLITTVSAEEPYEDPECLARTHLEHKFRLQPEGISDTRVEELHTRLMDRVNGNVCDAATATIAAESQCDELYPNIVPNYNAGERVRKDLTLECLSDLGNIDLLEYPFSRLTGECCGRTSCDEAHKKYQESESGDSRRGDSFVKQTGMDVRLPQVSNGQEREPVSHDCFREFHECVSLRSYNNEQLHILPYVVLD